MYVSSASVSDVSSYKYAEESMFVDCKARLVDVRRNACGYVLTDVLKI